MRAAGRVCVAGGRCAVRLLAIGFLTLLLEGCASRSTGTVRVPAAWRHVPSQGLAIRGYDGWQLYVPVFLPPGTRVHRFRIVPGDSDWYAYGVFNGTSSLPAAKMRMQLAGWYAREGIQLRSVPTDPFTFELVREGKPFGDITVKPQRSGLEISGIVTLVVRSRWLRQPVPWGGPLSYDLTAMGFGSLVPPCVTHVAPNAIMSMRGSQRLRQPV